MFDSEKELKMTRDELKERAWKGPIYNPDATLEEMMRESFMKSILGEDFGKRRFTADNRTNLVRYIRAGNSFTAAAKLCGITPSTVWRWMKRGNENLASAKDESDVDEYGQFAIDLMLADGEFESSMLEHLADEAMESGKGWLGTWLLERKYLHWRIPKKQEVELKGGDAVTIEFVNRPSFDRPPEDLAKLDALEDELEKIHGVNGEEIRTAFFDRKAIDEEE